MDKQLKKKVEQKIILSVEKILSGINETAALATKKKMKEAAKLVTKKFFRNIKGDKKLDTGKIKKIKKALPEKGKQVVYQMPKRDANGKFLKKKK